MIFKRVPFEIKLENLLPTGNNKLSQSYPSPVGGMIQTTKKTHHSSLINYNDIPFPENFEKGKSYIYNFRMIK